jgi:5-methylcytosine-specific restriction endonuclease McrA
MNSRDGLTKRCCKCGEIKLLRDFSKDKSCRDGYCQKCKSCTKIYCDLHSKEMCENAKKWNQEHPERVKASVRRYATRIVEKNPSVYKERSKAYRKAHHQKCVEEVQRYREQHREHAREVSLAWGKKHPEGAVAIVQRRRARKMNVGGTYTAEEWNSVCEKYNHRCLCCGEREPDIKLTVDHVIPISKGGINSIENIQPLCRSCNSKKSTKIIDFRGTRN